MLKRTVKIILAISLLAALPLCVNVFLTPKLFLISLAALLLSTGVKKISIVSAIIIPFGLIGLAAAPSYGGIFTVAAMISVLFILESDIEIINMKTPLRIAYMMISLYAILQFLGVDLNIWSYDWTGKRVFSLLGNPNALGIFCGAAALTEYFIFKDRKVYAVPPLLALAASLSKGALLAFALAFSFSLIKRPVLKKVLFAVSVLAVFLFVILLNFRGNTRYHIMRNTLSVIKKKPFGLGTGRFAPAYKTALADYNVKAGIKNARKLFVDNAHNEFLNAAAQWGIAGAALFTVLFLLFISGRDFCHDDKTAVIMFFFITGIYDQTLHDPAAAVILALCAPSFLKRIKYRIPSPGIILTAALSFAVIGIQFTGELSGRNIFLGRSRDLYRLAQTKKGFGIKEEYLKKAFREDIFPEMLNYWASLYAEQGRTEDAAEILIRSKNMVPELIATRKMLIGQYYALRDMRAVERELYGLLEYEKNDANYYSLFLSLVFNGKFKDALEIVEKMNAINTNILFFLTATGRIEKALRYAKDGGYEQEFLRALLERKENEGKRIRFPGRDPVHGKDNYGFPDMARYLPGLTSDEILNALNPVSYLSEFLEDPLASKNMLTVLKDQFFGFEFLEIPVFTLYGSDTAPLTVKVWPHPDTPDLSLLSGEKRIFANYLFMHNDRNAFKEMYELLRGKDKYRAALFALNHDRIYGNVLDIYGLDFIDDLGEVRLGASVDEYLLKAGKYLTKKENALIKKYWSIKTVDEIEYERLLNKKNWTMEEYFIFNALHIIKYPRSAVPDKDIIDMADYPNFRRLLQRYYENTKGGIRVGESK